MNKSVNSLNKARSHAISSDIKLVRPGPNQSYDVVKQWGKTQQLVRWEKMIVFIVFT